MSEMKKDAKRGYVPDDDRNFSPEELAVLKTASRHVCWLMDGDMTRSRPQHL